MVEEMVDSCLRDIEAVGLRTYGLPILFDNTIEAGIMCGTANNRTERMEGNGGDLPKWWGKADFGRMCSTFWRFFRHGILEFSRQI